MTPLGAEHIQPGLPCIETKALIDGDVGLAERIIDIREHVTEGTQELDGLYDAVMILLLPFDKHIDLAVNVPWVSMVSSWKADEPCPSRNTSAHWTSASQGAIERLALAKALFDMRGVSAALV
jgi:hypothetical protein